MQVLEFSSTLNLVAWNISLLMFFACPKENINYKKCSSEKLLVIYVKRLLFHARINFQFKTREQNLKMWGRWWIKQWPGNVHFCTGYGRCSSKILSGP